MRTTRLLQVVFMAVLVAGCGREGSLKHPSDLTAAEDRALQHLLMDVYKKSFKLREVQPFQGVETRLDPETGRELGRTIKTVGAVPEDYFFNLKDPKTRKVVDENVRNVRATWVEDGRKRELSIVEYSIGTLTGSLGDPLEALIAMATRDTVVICPFKVKVE